MHIDDSKKFDKRNIQRNIKDKIITHKDYDVYLSRLSDVGNKVFVPEQTSKRPISKGILTLNPRKVPVRKSLKENKNAHLRVSM